MTTPSDQPPTACPSGFNSGSAFPHRWCLSAILRPCLALVAYTD